MSQVQSVALASVDEPVENGSADLTTSVGASGNQGIDGLLYGIRWADGSITYSDPDSRSDYQADYPLALTNLQQVSASQMTAVGIVRSNCCGRVGGRLSVGSRGAPLGFEPSDTEYIAKETKSRAREADSDRLL